MANIINAITTGAGGISTTADASGSIQIATNNGTTAMTIDTSQNVGIGTTTPAYKLEVNGGSSAGFMRLASSTNPTGFDLGVGGSADPTAYIYNRNNTPLLFATNNTERMRIDSSGNVDIGITTGSAKLNVFQASNAQCINIGDGNAIDTGFYGVSQITRVATPGDNKFHLSFIRNGLQIAGIGFLNGSSTLYVGNSSATNANGMLLTPNATAWGSQSDERVKNIHGNIENAIQKIGEWRTVYFNYKIDEEGSKQRVGLIAQDVEKTAPEVVDSIGDEQDTLQVRYTEVIPFLVKAIQEQQTIINELKTRIETLEAK